MSHASWNKHHITQCEQRTGQEMLGDEHSLLAFGKDFGGLAQSKPGAVFSPATTQALQQAVAYANAHRLPVTVRAKGLSQCGQALPLTGGMTLHMEQFCAVHEQREDSVWVDANASWASLLAATLPHSRVPYVTPYNTNLSVAGLLSVGGVGAASFRHGVAASHVDALEIVTADGEIQRADASTPLAQACLAGLGQFGVMTKAAIPLRPCGKQVRTFSLVYLDKEQWLKDLDVFKHCADFIETVCSPALQGTRATARGRQPFAQWLFAMQVSFEYDTQAPELDGLGYQISPWKVSNCQDESMNTYLLRHDSRFQAMKLTGQWDMQHPWYECLVPQDVLLSELDDLLDSLPLYFATVVHLVPIANRRPAGFFMTPDQPEFFSVMILNPGVPPALVPGCLDAIKAMDERFLAQGGKRYLSGFLGLDLSPEYWKVHFGVDYENWSALKRRYDPNGIFGSLSLHHADD